MKKEILLLSIGMCTCAFTFAQQKDPFDIDKHLKKNSPVILAPQLKQSLQNPFYKKPFTTAIIRGLPLKMEQIYTCPNGDKVYSDPQFHMPVIVPDMSAFNMPVIRGTKEEPFTMPNGASPPGFRSLIK